MTLNIQRLQKPLVVTLGFIQRVVMLVVLAEGHDFCTILLPPKLDHLHIEDGSE
jgi:hypothetical protein